jgi:hypothetical protein
MSGSREAAMNARQRHTIVILVVVLISMTLLAAPARGDDWFGVGVGGHSFSLSFGSTDWAVWGGSWQNPGWTVDYHVALAGYGEWVWVDGIGQCWQPWVSPDWRPFTYGRWVWTSLGWTWVSYEPWGYFPHHFGHWAMAPVGWVWAPGTSYHPANVVWVSGGPWVGWYPRPPSGWHHHHGHHGDHDAYWAGWDDARYATYVNYRNLGSDDLGRYAVAASAVRASEPRFAVRNTVAAPDRHELGRRGVVVPEMSLERRTARVAGREVVLARPREAADSVERNAGRTVERGLAPQAVATLTRNSTGRQATAGRPVEPQRAAAGGRVAAEERSGRSAAPQGSRADSRRPSAELREQRQPAAARREAGSTPAARSSAPAARSAEAPRAPVAAGATRSSRPASDRMTDARRSVRRSVGAAAASERSAPARSSSASRPAAGERRESTRQESSSRDETKGRAEERARRSDQPREKSAQGSSPRSARR